MSRITIRAVRHRVTVKVNERPRITLVAPRAIVAEGGGLQGFSFPIHGKTRTDDGRLLGGTAPSALSIKAAKSTVKARVAPTAFTVFGIVLNTVEVATVSIAVNGSAVFSNDFEIAAGDMIYIECPAVPDVTLADIAFLLRA